MIRSELIQKIADDNPHLYQRDVERIVNTIFEEITGAMADNEIQITDKKTGETVNVEEKHVPFFKTGKLLRDRLNGNT